MDAVIDRFVSDDRFLRDLASDQRIDRRAAQPTFSCVERVGELDFLDCGLFDLFFDDGGGGFLTEFNGLFRDFDDFICFYGYFIRIGSVGAVTFRRGVEDRYEIPLSLGISRITADLRWYVGVYS